MIFSYINIIYQVETKWSDHRLRFQQLKENFRQNELDYNTLWKPTIFPEGTIFKDLLAYKKHKNSISTMYAKREDSGPYIFIDGFEGLP